MNYVLGNKKAIAVFLAPALLVYLAVMVIPVVWSFVYGFYQGNPILGFEFTGFDNFTKDTLAQANPWRHLAEIFWAGGWVLIFLAIVNSTIANSNAGSNAATRTMFAMGRVRIGSDSPPLF